MLYRSLMLIILALLLAVSGFACRKKDSPEIQIDGDDGQILTMTELNVGEFQPESGRGMAMMAGGITIEDDAHSAEFTTDIITATHPFNYVVPEWTADIPTGANIEAQIRMASLNGVWTSWQIIHLDPDTSLPDESIYTGTHIDNGNALTFSQRVQLRITLLPNSESHKPVITKLSLSFIDSTGGPTTEEIIDNFPNDWLDSDITGAIGYPKPRVISRKQWCTHQNCDYTQGLATYPVSHLIVHHTVSSNGTTDWASNVRAIWMFHTFTRGWGDVGYNYLIDPNGNIYEGHNGGDDVMGTHASAANRGSMGVALLGTFSTHEVPEPMKAALVELLAWKADQKNIDLFDASRLPLLDWGNLHLMGHRDAFGETECPGDLAHDDLAEIRQRVDNKLGRTEEYAYLDELSSGFSKSDARWRDGPRQCGFNAHSYYTSTTSDASKSTNSAEWRPNIPADGAYQVEAYVPFCKTGMTEATQASYRVSGADGTQTVVRSHQDNIGLWMDLGQFNFSKGTGNVIQLTDKTQSDNGVPIWFDAIRYKATDGSAPPPAVATDTTPPSSQITEVYKNCDGDFALKWDGSDDQSGINHYDISYKRPGSNQWVTILNDSKLNSYTFSPPDQNSGYRFRSQATDNKGNQEATKSNGDMGDGVEIPCNIQPPDLTSPVGEGWITDRKVTFKWTIGNADAVKEFTIAAATDAEMKNVVMTHQADGSSREFQHDFSRDYSRLYWSVTAKTHFDQLAASTVRSFRLDGAAPESTVYDVYKLANGDYQVNWRGEDQASGITDFTVEYSEAGTLQWEPFQTNTSKTSAVFKPPSANKTYRFRSLARDVAGNREAGTTSGDFSSAEACPYIASSPKLTQPLDKSVLTNHAITFRWNAPKDRCISESVIEVASDANFSNVIHTQKIEGSRNSYSFTADPSAETLWWRATYTTVLGESFRSDPISFGFDRSPPVSQIIEVLRTPLPPYAYIVKAAGSDSQTGIASFIFEYRADDKTEWVRWAVSDSDSVAFLPPTGGLYWFRSMAIDGGGNIEPADSNGDLSSADSTATHNLILPLIVVNSR